MAPAKLMCPTISKQGMHILWHGFGVILFRLIPCPPFTLQVTFLPKCNLGLISKTLIRKSFFIKLSQKNAFSIRFVFSVVLGEFLLLRYLLATALLCGERASVLCTQLHRTKCTCILGKDTQGLTAALLWLEPLAWLRFMVFFGWCLPTQ